MPPLVLGDRWRHGIDANTRTETCHCAPTNMCAAMSWLQEDVGRVDPVRLEWPAACRRAASGRRSMLRRPQQQQKPCTAARAVWRQGMDGSPLPLSDPRHGSRSAAPAQQRRRPTGRAVACDQWQPWRCCHEHRRGSDHAPCWRNRSLFYYFTEVVCCSQTVEPPTSLENVTRA